MIMRETKVIQFQPPTRRNQPRTLKIETQGAVVFIEFREDADGHPVTLVEVNPDGTRYGQDWRTEDAAGDEITGLIRVANHAPRPEG
jgi:hypothetical protein